jgi:hypothetical protein
MLFETVVANLLFWNRERSLADKPIIEAQYREPDTDYLRGSSVSPNQPLRKFLGASFVEGLKDGLRGE